MGGGILGPGGGCTDMTGVDGARASAASFCLAGFVQSISRRPPTSMLVGLSDDQKKP